MAYHYSIQRRRGASKGAEARLSRGQSVLVIGGLSALAWGIIIAIGASIFSYL